MRLWERSPFGLGPPQVPPPTRLCGFMSPARARPVPFWRYSLRPEPTISLRPLVEAVKRRRASSSATTARCMTCSFGSVSKSGPLRSRSDRSPLPASKRCALATLITRLSDPNDRALAARHTAAHPELVVLGVDGDDPQVLDRDALVAHLPRHLLPRKDPRGIRRSSDGARLPDVVRAMRYRPATEAVSLDGPLESFTLGDRGDVYLVSLVEDGGPDGSSALAGDVAQLLEGATRRDLVLLERARLRPVNLARRHSSEAHRDCVVAVFVGGPHRRDEVRLYLDHGHAHERAVILEGLGHVLLASEYSSRHARLPLSLCSRRPGGPDAASYRPSWASAAGCR